MIAYKPLRLVGMGVSSSPFPVPNCACLCRKKAQSLTKAERKATVAKKVRGDKKGKQFVKNTKKAEYKKK